jgi:hypothetical protein
MMAGNFPAPGKGGIKLIQEMMGTETKSSQVIYSIPVVLKVQNLFIIPSYSYITNHRGCSLHDIQAGLGYPSRYSNYSEPRWKIYDAVEILMFARLVRKQYHRYFPTEKQARITGVCCT